MDCTHHGQLGNPGCRHGVCEDTHQFYVVRFLLGVAEAGFFPGIIYYLADWFPRSYHARAIGRFTVAIPIAQALGGLAGAPLLRLGGIGELSGWQWLFLAEGIPSVLLGVSVLWYLPGRPQEAAWLGPSQRTWLLARIAADRAKAVFADPTIDCGPCVTGTCGCWPFRTSPTSPSPSVTPPGLPN